MRGHARILVLLLAGSAMTVALSGCVGISATSTQQPESLGPVQLTFTACAQGAPGCGATSNTGEIYEPVGTESAPHQLLIAVRLPEGSTPPEKLLGSTGAVNIPFLRSPALEAELQALEPAAAGERWWGWISGERTYSQKTIQSFTVTITASLPRPADGGPFESPLRWRPVVGVRAVDPGAGLPADRPVKCGTANNDLYEGYAEVGITISTTCIDSPGKEAARGFLTAPLTDFGIVGSNVQGSPGSSVTAAFLAKRSGAPDPPTTFSLAAQSGIPGGSVSIDRTAISLGGDSTQPVLATIGIPAGTPSATYPVTLVASSPGKPTRTGTVGVTVTSPSAGGAPRIKSASLSHRRFRTGGKRPRAGGGSAPVGTKLRLDLSKAAVVSIEVAKLAGKRAKALGTLRKSLPAGGSTISIRGRIGKVRLMPGRYRLTLTAGDGGGGVSAPIRLSFTVVTG